MDHCIGAISIPCLLPMCTSSSDAAVSEPKLKACVESGSSATSDLYVVMLEQNPIQEMISYGPGTLVAQSDQDNDTGKLQLLDFQHESLLFAS